MNRHLIRTAAAFACIFLGATAAHAQFYPGPGQSYYSPRTPALSPYLNMLRGGDPAANYFLGVVPERQRRYNDLLFQRDIQELQRREELTGETAGISNVLPGTGHPVYFNTTATYFNSIGARPGTPLPQFGTGTGIGGGRRVP
jgi:hypothetical protein